MVNSFPATRKLLHKRTPMTLIFVQPKESRKSDDKDGRARNISTRNRSSRGSILEFPKLNISHRNEAGNPPEVNSREHLSPRQGNYTQENMRCICHEFRWSKSTISNCINQCIMCKKLRGKPQWQTYTKTDWRHLPHFQMLVSIFLAHGLCKQGSWGLEYWILKDGVCSLYVSTV